MPSVFERFKGYMNRVYSHVTETPLTFFKSFFSLDAWKLFVHEQEAWVFKRRAEQLLQTQGHLQPNETYMNYIMGDLTEKAENSPQGFALRTFTDESWSLDALLLPTVNFMVVQKGDLLMPMANLDTKGVRKAFWLPDNLIGSGFTHKPLTAKTLTEKGRVKAALISDDNLQLWPITSRHLEKLANEFNPNLPFVPQLKQCVYEIFAEAFFDWTNLPKNFHQLAEQFETYWQFSGETFFGYEYYLLKQRFTELSSQLHKHIASLPETHRTRNLLQFLVRHHGLSSEQDINLAGFLATVGNYPNAVVGAVNHLLSDKTQHSHLDKALEEIDLTQEQPLTQIKSNTRLFIHRIVNEVLRASNVGRVLPRVNATNRAIAIGLTGQFMPAKTVCMINQAQMCMRVKEPLTFNPARAGLYRAPVFGIGKRMCPGQSYVRDALACFILLGHQKLSIKLTSGIAEARTIAPSARGHYLTLYHSKITAELGFREKPSEKRTKKRRQRRKGPVL